MRVSFRLELPPEITLDVAVRDGFGDPAVYEQTIRTRLEAAGLADVTVDNITAYLELGSKPLLWGMTVPCLYAVVSADVVAT